MSRILFTAGGGALGGWVPGRGGGCLLLGVPGPGGSAPGGVPGLGV